mgnify:CR=1 FL=1
MSLALTTELDAVNTMLSVIGEAPVNTIENTGVVDAVIAKQILDETMRQVQVEGWHWNRDVGVVLTPTYPLPGDIYLPANTLSVDAMDPQIDVISRGNRLYDKTRNTYKFDGPVTVEITRLLPFEEIPQAARSYIMIRAARIFQDRVLGSEKLSGFNAADESRALAQLRMMETETGDYNMLNGNWAVARVLYRRP